MTDDERRAIRALAAAARSYARDGARPLQQDEHWEGIAARLVRQQRYIAEQLERLTQPHKESTPCES